MPAILANARYFLNSSDYPQDKIVYLKKLSVTVTANNYKDITIAHGLPFTPLIRARWSTNASYVPTYEESTGPRNGAGILYQTAVYSDETNIKLQTSNNTGSQVTIYYYLYGFAPAGVTSEVPYTSSMVINSRKTQITITRNYT